jgi:hypothetical protein
LDIDACWTELDAIAKDLDWDVVHRHVGMSFHRLKVCLIFMYRLDDSASSSPVNSRIHPNMRREGVGEPYTSNQTTDSDQGERNALKETDFAFFEAGTDEGKRSPLYYEC